jgi:hypothetical protein
MVTQETHRHRSFKGGGGMMLIRVLPNSKAVDALCICYSYQRVYRHDGKGYFVRSLKATGVGRSTRLEAELEPVWGSEVFR